MKLGEICTVMIRGTNILVINPYEEDHKESIIKAVETSKMDVNITTEDSNVIVTLGAIPKDVKNEVIQTAKKVNDRFRDSLKGVRQAITSEIKRLEKIISKDESKRIEKNLLNELDKQIKSCEQIYKRKEEEIKSV